jgi:hypothetical protein
LLKRRNGKVIVKNNKVGEFHNKEYASVN